MNRYIADGALTDAMHGRRVLIVCHPRDWHMVEERAETNPVRARVSTIYRANGRQRVTFWSGGEVVHVSSLMGADTLRGKTADVVLLLDGTGEEAGWTEHALIVTAPSKTREVMR